MPATADTPTVSLSCQSLHNFEYPRTLNSDLIIVANNFWGKDDAGVPPLLERMHDAKVTSDELKSFYTGGSHDD